MHWFKIKQKGMPRGIFRALAFEARSSSLSQASSEGCSVRSVKGLRVSEASLGQRHPTFSGANCPRQLHALQNSESLHNHFTPMLVRFVKKVKALCGQHRTNDALRLYDLIPNMTSTAG